MRSLWTALGFLTVLPVPFTGRRRDLRDLGRAAGWFPLIGLGLGVGLAGAHGWLSRWFPAPVVAALVVSLWVVLTGGLHLDGLADVCDALFAPVTEARRREILRDPCLGAFGALGLILALVLKVAGVAGLSGGEGLLAAPVFGRWLMVLPAVLPLRWREGSGAAFRAGVGRREMLVAAAVPVGVALAVGPAGWLALAVVHLTAGGALHLAERRLGGVSGDVLGALNELAEIVTLLVFVLAQGAMPLAELEARLWAG